LSLLAFWPWLWSAIIAMCTLPSFNCVILIAAGQEHILDCTVDRCLWSSVAVFLDQLVVYAAGRYLVGCDNGYMTATYMSACRCNHPHVLRKHAHPHAHTHTRTHVHTPTRGHARRHTSTHTNGH
jgi:hypothetical protein